MGSRVNRSSSVLLQVVDWHPRQAVIEGLPGLAAVRGAVKAALFVGAVGMAEHGSEDSIGIARIDGERGNLEAIAQAEMSPGFSGVGRFIDSVAH